MCNNCSHRICRHKVEEKVREATVEKEELDEKIKKLDDELKGMLEQKGADNEEMNFLNKYVLFLLICEL